MVTKSHVGNYALPNPRVLSSVAHGPRDDRSFYNHLFMAWGQYLNHDLQQTPVSTADYQGGLIKCCPNSNHPQCAPISIPPNDPIQGRYKRSCINFVRSAPCPLCSLSKFKNETTSVIVDSHKMFVLQLLENNKTPSHLSLITVQCMEVQ